MSCASLREELQAYLDGELQPPTRVALEAHLKTCGPCRAAMKELEDVSGTLSRWRDRVPSDKFDFMLQFSLSTENLPSEGTTAHESPAAAPAQRAAAEVPRRHPALKWATSGYRPAALVAAALLFVVGIVAMQRGTNRKRPLGPIGRVEMARAFLDAGPTGDVAAASIYAANAAKRAVSGDQLDPARVASSEVVYSFLASMDSNTEKGAGFGLVKLLSRRRARYTSPQRTAMGSLGADFQFLITMDLHAAGTGGDMVTAGRRYELQGRLREALSRYAQVREPGASPRARLAEGALKLRMGDLRGARESLDAAVDGPDAVVRISASALLTEIDEAERGRDRLAPQRAQAKTPMDWYRVGILEVRAYDFRNAANSFMRAANAMDADQQDLIRDARFRSAWCQKEIGQISTAVYGFRSVASESPKQSSLGYCASILEAVSLSRVGRYDQSVAVCRELLREPPPDDARELEALAYFHKGCVELRRHEINAAAESLGRVAAGGHGNLSFAALSLLQSRGR